jgi:ribosomal protein S18 acetylase RimI-like enzyme
MAAERSFPKTVSVNETPDRVRIDLFDASGYIVGFVKIDRPAHNVMYIWHLKVVREFRNMGHARRLMEAALSHAKGNPHTDIITINACPFEDGACPLNALVRFYESFGFRTFSSTATTKSMKLELKFKGLRAIGTEKQSI